MKVSSKNFFSMTNFPSKISFLSDNTEAKLVSDIADKKSKEKIATYVYTVALVNLGKEFTMSMEQINKLQDAKLILWQ